MTKATWNNAVLAESAETTIIEGNHYFPPESVNHQYLVQSDHHTTCPWKGLANYYDIKVGDSINKEAAWCYPAPKDAAKEITGYVAFWKGVKVEP